MDRLSKFIINLEIYNKTLLPVNIRNFRGMQIVCQGIFLEEYILTKNCFIKDKIYIILDRMVIPEQLR